jgi:glyoxylate reductase
MTMPDKARPKVYVTRELTDPVMQRMAELFDVTINLTGQPATGQDLIAAVQGYDVIVPTITDRIDADLIAHAGDRLKLIANFGAGVDHIDLDAAKAKGLLVTNTPGVLTEDTADMAMAMILAVPRRFAEGEQIVRAGKWSGWKPGDMLGHRIGGKTLGIFGMGRIGRAIAARARPFGLKLVYHNRHRLPETVEAELGVTWADSIQALAAVSDIFSINCPHSAATHHIVNAALIGQMKPTAAIINTARGEIIDEEALIAALQSSRIAGAGLDVYHNEPHVDPRFLTLPNVVLLPHMGSATYEGRDAMGEKVITNIRAWVDGHRPPDMVIIGWD